VFYAGDLIESGEQMFKQSVFKWCCIQNLLCIVSVDALQI